MGRFLIPKDIWPFLIIFGIVLVGLLLLWKCVQIFNDNKERLDTEEKIRERSYTEASRPWPTLRQLRRPGPARQTPHPPWLRPSEPARPPRRPRAAQPKPLQEIELMQLRPQPQPEQPIPHMSRSRLGETLAMRPPPLERYGAIQPHPAAFKSRGVRHAKNVIPLKVGPKPSAPPASP